MQIQSQNQNFGAIKINRLKFAEPHSLKANKLAVANGKLIETGQTFFKNKYQYIQTERGSELENKIITAIKKLLKKEAKGKIIQVTSCSDAQAAKNIKRYEKHAPSVFNRKK